MDFKQIEAFINVAKHKSFSRAADAIFLSQPTISSHIASLEQELKTTLFDRNGKEVKLTPAGTIFLDYAVNLINMRNNAMSSLNDFDNKISGNISIGSSTTPCRFLLPKIIKSFNENYPSVKFNIKEDNTKNIINMVLSSEIDVGIVGEIIDDPRLSYRKICDDSLIAISNNMGLPDVIPIDMFLNQNFILREKGSATRDVFENALLKLGYSPNKLNIIAVTNSVESILQLVKNSLGISIVSKLSCIDYINANIIHGHSIENMNINRNIYAVIHNKRTKSPTVKAFYSHIIGQQ